MCGALLFGFGFDVGDYIDLSGHYREVIFMVIYVQLYATGIYMPATRQVAQL